MPLRVSALSKAPEGYRMPILITASWVVGCLLAISNHFFFARLDGRLPYSYDTAAMLNNAPGTVGTVFTPAIASAVANALAEAVKLLFGFVITMSLVQAMWQTICSQRMSIAQLDIVFGLSSSSNALRILCRKSCLNFLPSIALLSSLYFLSLISVFAPGSLVVAQNALGRLALIDVPVVNLSGSIVGNVILADDPGETQPSLRLNADTFAAITAPQGLSPSWSTPAACGMAQCSYSFSYWAPALRCVDLTLDQIADQTETNISQFSAQLDHWSLGNSNDNAYVYNGTTNMPAPGHTANVSDPYSLIVAFLGSDNKPQGASCIFYNATYTVASYFTDFSASPDNTINITATHNNLTDPWTQPDSDCAWSPNLGANADNAQTTLLPCLTEALNARAMAMSFVNVFLGTLRWSLGEVNTAAYVTPLIDFDFVNRNISLPETLTNSFIPVRNVTPSLSARLELLMAYTTLAGIGRYQFMQSTIAVVNQGNNFYSYNPLRFWGVYGSFILITFLCGLYGLRCLRPNGCMGTLNFSDLVGYAQTPGMAALMVRHPDGRRNLTDERKELTEVEFGEVDVGEKERILAFGVVGVDNVIPLGRGGVM